MDLSAADCKLLGALQTDARISQIDLADRSGLSRTSVWRRIRELEERGIIDAHVAILNPEALGLQIHVLLSVTMVEHSDAIRHSFEAHVQRLSEVMECFSVSGERDYILQIISRDMRSYNDFLNTQILHHPSVLSASSSFALRRVKYTTALPLQNG
ncbi:MAG: Lrp/AsnC family transcriptional regulator [Lysobacterales bacterium]|jgi:Lrp/AsnC family transcriptional regulator